MRKPAADGVSTSLVVGARRSCAVGSPAFGGRGHAHSGGPHLHRARAGVLRRSPGRGGARAAAPGRRSRARCADPVGTAFAVQRPRRPCALPDLRWPAYGSEAWRGGVQPRGVAADAQGAGEDVRLDRRGRVMTKVIGGRFYGRLTPGGPLVPTEKLVGEPDAWICRRLADFPRQ